MAKEGSVAPPERVNIRYKPATGDAQEEVELPLKMLFLGDYTGRPDPRPLEDRKPINVDKDNFQQVLAEQKLELTMSVPEVLSGEANSQLNVNLKFRSLSDFGPEAVAQQVPELKRLLDLRDALTALKGPLGNVPAFRKKIQELLADPTRRAKLMEELGISDGKGTLAMTQQSPEGAAAAGGETSLLDEILGETRMGPTDDGYDIAKRGVQAFIAELLAPGHEAGKVDKSLVDAMIAEIDRKVSIQLDQVLHAPEFQKLESAWRGLKFVIDKTNFRENTKVELVNVSKDDLQADFEDAPEIVKSGLYKIAYTAEYGTFGGKPIGAMFGNYEFGPGAQDIQLLSNLAAVACMAHAPFFSSVGASFFGCKEYTEFPNLKDLRSLFEGPQYTKWNSFRETEDARYIGLCMPRMLLRLPYGENTVPLKAFNYNEDVVGKHNDYLWGNASYAMATRIADSFAKFRWCPNIIGPAAGGTVENLPLHQYQAMGEIQTKCPTEVILSERREFELSEEGFIALCFRKDSDNAAFFSANSAQKCKTFGQSAEGKEAELNYRLGTQLPYIFVACRIAHYLKVIQREQIGTFKERADLEKELNTWIKQYVADQDFLTPEIRGRCPLRKALITVEEVPGQAGFYKVDMKVRPHFKYMGASFTLSLVGKLDKT